MPLGDSIQPRRRAHRKVKTGCRTCRLRRVKCDEGFPACRRCISVGRVCDGYGIWGGGGIICAQDGEIQTTQKQSPTLSSQAISTVLEDQLQPLVIPGPRISPQEQSYLEWFIHGTAVQTPTIFNSPFWDPMILRCTLQHPMVLRALLALSAVHKRKVLDPANRARDGLPPDAQEIFFLKQYNRALRAMQDVLQGKDQSQKSRLILSLVMCGIFTLLESLRGNFEAGKIHLASGSKLAKQFVRGPYSDGCESKFIQFFARLGDQSQVYEQHKQSAKQIVTPLSISVQVSPELRFMSLEEAGHHLDALLDLLAHSVEQARKIPRSRIDSRRLLEKEHAYLVAACEAWDLAFDATFREKMEGMSAEDISAWKVLKERHTMAKAAAGKFLVSHGTIDDTEGTVGSGKTDIDLAEISPRNIMFVAHGDLELQKRILFNGTKWYS